MSAAMEQNSGCRFRRAFMLQDRKRLPGRFFARLQGTSTSRLG
jgi:hypothetical protein